MQPSPPFPSPSRIIGIILVITSVFGIAFLSNYLMRQPIPLPLPINESKQPKDEKKNGSTFYAKRNEKTFSVRSVIDGDTIELSDGTRVRLIGINTPERDQPFYGEAKQTLTDLVLGDRVRLEKDISDTDRYGRWLRYVFLEDTFINYEMVRQGFANTYTVPPDVMYQDVLLKAEREAREQKRGLWKGSPSKKITFEVLELRAAQNEYVTLKNASSEEVFLKNWTLKDAGTHIFTFPDISVKPNDTITIYSEKGSSTETTLYWNNPGPIWNNDGDTLYLRDLNGYLILEYSY